MSATVARTIKKFSEPRRNAIRGAVADARRTMPGTTLLNAVRANSSETDMAAAAVILESPAGLRKRRVEGLLQSDIALAHALHALPANLEAAYACGFLNSWKHDSIRAFETIAILSQMTEVPRADAIGALLRTAQKWGASNYLALKIAYVKEFLELADAERLVLSEIDELLGHAKSPTIQYSALENLKTRLSIFSVARRHTNILLDHIDGDFRRYHSLNNVVATPFSTEDCAGFLLRAVETSLIDAARCLWIVVNLRSRFPDVYRAIERNLDPEILGHLLRLQRGIANSPVPDVLAGTAPLANPDEGAVDELPGEERSLSLYRRSIAFLEFPQLCSYRNDLDRVIGHRLVAPLLPDISRWHADGFSNIATLKQADGVFELAQHGQDKVQVDTFYRTYLFLRLIQDAANLSQLSSEEVQYICDNTMRLETLLLERELKTMHLNASDEARAIISVLALALYRSKSSDPDIDFDFRANLEDYIIRNFGGSIPDFIDHLAPKSPDVANYIASSLDEVTLQKMYQIIDSPLAAESARRDILTSVGIHLNKIEYIIEAEAIETRAKVAKLKDYFDASRMFVDSVAMNKWLSSNPSAYTEQYKELLPKLTARLAASQNVVTASGKEATIDIVQITSTDEYLVERIATEAFREFCVNNEFGIESYLGRRIRHNTLQGVMTNSVDAVLRRPEHHPVIAGTPFGAALRSWEHSYKVFIERMRRDFLQFRSEAKPQALFDARIDPADQVTRRNLNQLVQTLRRSGPEMLDELIISFCWRQIAPQLEFASRQIRVKMTQDVTQHLDHILQRFNGPEEIKIKSALEDAVASVFTQVASWFQVPQTGFVPASIPEICNIIDIEYGRTAAPTIVSGKPLLTKYYGISVHRLYDCLAVLLQNAFKHGKAGTDVTVHMSSSPIEETNLHVLEVAVRSVLPASGGEKCIARVSEALTSSETGRDMVTEGYSGIKKVKFITRLNEGKSTVSFDLLDDAIELRFRLKTEVAGGENDD
ncbi:hypothetical protein [Sphingobium chlorophenolicum]|uniref:hypothetical protein n=1 Tax=Sphingobium chlorophenolicum TaxID=46429 RepID=UPI00068F26BB|nr:hypothetical protein [Sphingobium chlorophenolicum]